MSKLGAQRGKSFEYRCRDFFRNKGYTSERIPLSGAVNTLKIAMGKHDLYARKGEVFYQVECKKTGKGAIPLQNLWLSKINFSNDEFLMFGFGRSDIFVLLTEERFNLINKTPYKPEVDIEIPGDSIFKLQHTVAQQFPRLKWTSHSTNYIVLDASHFLDLRERYQEDLVFENKVEAPNPIEFIKKVDDVQKLLDFDKNNNLSYMEKRVLYSKLERMEAGQTIIDPSFINEGQFWLKEEDKPLILKLSPEERAAFEIEAELRNVSATDLLLKLLRSFLKVQIEKRQAGTPNV